MDSLSNQTDLSHFWGRSYIQQMLGLFIRSNQGILYLLCEVWYSLMKTICLLKYPQRIFQYLWVFDQKKSCFFETLEIVYRICHDLNEICGLLFVPWNVYVFNVTCVTGHFTTFFQSQNL